MTRKLCIKQAYSMLVMGVCNPAGEAEDYNGLYLTDTEIRALTLKALRNVPVKAEHRGQELGRVVSSFVDCQGKLNCVMRISEDTVEGAIAAGLVKDGIARELSLGYTVDVEHTGQKLQAGAKRVLEVSLVRRGAREACYITAFEEEGKGTRWRTDAASSDPWAVFDMR